MKRYSISDIQEIYDFELEKIISKIKKEKAKNVLLQFPDGLKHYATTIVDYLKKNLLKNNKKVEFFIWFGSCFGACDTPVLPKNFEEKFDLIIQFGHNELMPGY
ncbi:MAG: diphthamide synthesis protein [Minisyncoccales bacterium]